MNKNINHFLSSILILSFLLSHAQSNNIDSLRLVLKTRTAAPSLELAPTIKGISTRTNGDTTYLTTLNELAWQLRNNNPDTSIFLSTQALNLSLALFTKEEALSHLGKVRERSVARSAFCLGVFNERKGNYLLSLDYYSKTLKIWELLNNEKGIAFVLGNIGNIYVDKGEYPKALDCFFKALKIAEESGNENGISAWLGNIGNVYRDLTDYQKAFEYYSKALKVAEKLGNKTVVASWLCNIGIVYKKQGDNSQALDYYFKALKIAQELGNKNIISSALGNIGEIYHEQANEAKSHQNITRSDSLFGKALEYDFKTLKLMEEQSNKKGIAACLGNIGNVYTNMKRYREAEKYLQKALSISTEANLLDVIKDHQQYLSELYEQMQQPAKALEHYKKFITVKDSLFNENNTKKTVRSEMNFEFDKKQAIEKAEQEKQNAITQQEKQKQKIILILVSCFLLIVAVFASFMFNRWRITQKQKLIIEKQKEKIMDSITYAQLIQQSILMEESEIQKLLPECFIYFQPKDIVSGDFYWCSKINDKIIIAAVDCTGHGVPGAFMSMIGNTLLNQIVNEKQITTPSEILKQLNVGVTEALHQKKEGALSRDGMDIAICCIDYSTDQIQYAGAQNPLFILTDNEINVIKADIQSIGGDELFLIKKKNSSTIEYTNHSFPIKNGMSVFLFSDGFMDQFGGKERKKFGMQKFKELLLNNQHLSMQQQKEAIANTHQDWKGSTSQIDDILVIGMKL
jgi:tetratricopeptide (TPR) repeat protein